MTVKKTICAACGRRLRPGKALKVEVWADEDVAPVVCSTGCRQAYESGDLDARRARRGEVQKDYWVAACLMIAALSELARLMLAYYWADPLGMVVPWPSRLAGAVLLAVPAAALLAGRRTARGAAVAIAAITAAGHVWYGLGSHRLTPLLAAVSYALPVASLLVGRPGPLRRAAALAAALLVPTFIGWSGLLMARQHWEAQERIAALVLPRDQVESGPNGLRLTELGDWHVLRRDNGLVDWPHAEFELVNPGTGALAFAVWNPDCDRRGLATFQDRSLEALAQAGLEPVPIGLIRIAGGITELRVRLRRGATELISYELFREVTGSHFAKASKTDVDAADQGLRGCLWLHCTATTRFEKQVRRECRQIASTIELGRTH
jgi:hypothetical protein